MRLQDFFSGKRVFLTGHTGFKGGWLCHVLHKFDANVTGFALEPEKRGIFRSCNTQAIINHNIGDVNDYDKVEKALFESEPDLVIHMAAQPLVTASYGMPLATFGTNILGTANVLMAAHNCQSRPIVAVVTSDKCYENFETTTPYKETDRMGGRDPYSASKGAAEIVTSSLAKSFLQQSAQSVLTLRGGNVIGGGDWAKDRIMTDMIEALLANRSPIIRSPQSIRPWQHVLDVLSGYLAAIVALDQLPAGSFDQYNIGPCSDNEANVSRLAGFVCDYWGSGVKPDMSTAKVDLHEAKILKLDIKKALDQLDWAPKFNFETTVKKTVDWYKAESKGEDMASFTLKQINNYFMEA